MPESPQDSNHITIRCACGKGYRLPIEAAGKKAKCACGRVFVIPVAPPKDERALETRPKKSKHKSAEGLHIEPISRLFLYLLICCTIFGPVSSLLSRTWKPEILRGLTVWLGLCGGIMQLVLLHQMWTTIQIGRVRTTPGKAVGYLFIPFYNLYWFFQAYFGWTEDYNGVVLEYDLEGPRMSEGLGLIVCFSFFGLAGLALVLFLILSACRTVAEYQHAAQFWVPVYFIICLIQAFLVSIFFYNARTCANFLARKVFSGELASLAHVVGPARRSQMADWSLVCGIVGFGTMTGTSIAGLVIGLMALREIRKSAGTVCGRAEAIAGIFLSTLLLLIFWLPRLIMFARR